ncbi:hypothetical protein DL764_002290 [Monosporascus ibericus]|uniref:Protein kinase domain-containing protein n=1 Tax=Monosporascus ibericus TaxID=155417 RepID=A0A4Q4TL17_9PEZI|nr:hypothetical protein DL764_002290 [Monosporascus ibericus]
MRCSGQLDGDDSAALNETFKNAKDVWDELGAVWVESESGRAQGIVVTAKGFSRDEGCDLGLKNSIQVQIYQLASDVVATKVFLEQNLPNLFGRAIFAISDQRKAEELNKALKLDKQALAQILTINDIRTRHVPDQLLFSNKRVVHYRNVGYEPVPSALNLFFTREDYREDPDNEITVIIERSVFDDEPVSENALKDIAAFLCYRQPRMGFRQSADMPLKGILLCLGYSMDPAPELGVPRHPLDFRFRLARRLSEAVIRVHATNLVHKNIRADTILILQTGDPPAEGDHDHNNPLYASGFGDAYLTGWRLLWDPYGASREVAGSDWTENIYRHPKRQGTDVEERNPADGQPQISPLFTAAVGVNDNNHADPEAELRAELSRPTTVKNILRKVARENLPQRMGIG